MTIIYKIGKKLARIAFLCAWVTNVYSQEKEIGKVVIQPVNMARVKEIAAILPAQPRGFGDPIEQRSRWDSLYRTGKFERLITQADSICKMPFPKLTDAIYMSYFGGKDSETSKRFIMKRRMLLSLLVWAECLTDKGKYMPAINAALDDILHTPSWAFPAEDQQKLNYEGKLYTIGLSSAAYGADIAECLYLLRSKLTDNTKSRMYDLLQVRIFQPTLNAIRKKNANKQFVSLMDTGNHNAVTLAYVTLAAFAALPDREQRAVFATIAERYTRNFLIGYLDDGYCSEGIGYYSYGFGHYTMLRDLLWTHTSGKIDLFNDPKVSKMALFAPAMEIINGVYPAISDCEQRGKPWPQLMYYLDKDQHLGLKEYQHLSADIEQPALNYLMYFFPNAASASAKASGGLRGYHLRDYFEQAGVLTVRPPAGVVSGLGATLKGGDNAEQHNHNDVGSYTVVAGRELLTGDVGLATYTPKYFSKERYTLFKTTASYGHNVPLLNGVQQHVGKDAHAQIISTSFTDECDQMIMDIASAYNVPELKTLNRTFSYARINSGELIVRDDFTFNRPGNFETALITRFPWKKISDRVIEIMGKESKLRVTITTSGQDIAISNEVIDEGPSPYTRIAIRLTEPIAGGFVSVKYEKE